jgi:Flp pilus assembly protein TadG
MQTRNMRQFIRSRLRSWRETGQTIALMAIVLPAFIGAAGLAVDVGNFYFNYYKIQTAADATVLSAVQYLPNTGAAQTAACCGTTSYGVANSLTGTDTVTFPILTADTIQMSVRRTVPYYFARLVGVDSGTLNVTATAITGSPGSVNFPDCTGGTCTPPSSLESNLVPIGLDSHTVASYTAGQPVDLIFRGISDNGPQYWGGLILGGTGASRFADELEFGFKYKLSVGDAVPPETGRKKGPTAKAIQDRIDLGISLYPSDSCPVGTCAVGSTFNPKNPRAVTVPLIDWSVCSKAASCTIEGFASVWLQGVGAGSGCPGSADICGVWITTIMDGTINPGAPSYGTKVAKLH